MTSIGDEAFYGCSGLTGVTIPSSVTSIGKGAFNSCKDLTSVTIPPSVTSIDDYVFQGCSGLTSVTIPSSVTSIGQYAFYGCSGLASVTIPSSVTSIGQYAFHGCSKLTSVTIPSSVTSIGQYAFCTCSGLTSVTIPSSVMSISIGAFNGCNGLTSVTIPEGVTSIGSRAFYGCSKLTSVTIPSSVTSIGESAFCGCRAPNMVTIPEGVSVIWRYAFSGCRGLTSVTIPLSVTSIGSGALQGCTGLTSVTIPSSVTSIGSGALQGCTGLTSVTIPSSVTNIGESAFSGCTGLTSVTIPSSVTSIGSGALQGCTGLTSVTIPSSVTSIGQNAFDRCSGLTSVTIPEGVTSIGQYAFNGCSGLTSVTIPEGVTSIGSAAFYGCSKLTSVTIPSSVTSIGLDAFANGGIIEACFAEGTTRISDFALSGCRALTSVTIPLSVTSIGRYAFSCCSGLMSVTIPSSVTSIGDEAFSGCSGLMSVTIPLSVTGIGDFAFSACSALTSVTIPLSVTSFGRYAFHGCSRLASVTIPSSVTSIGQYAFHGCSGLTSVTIPSGVTSIGEGVFSGCSGLTSVTIPLSVTGIGERAFSGCSGLTSVTIPSSVTSIGDFAFNDCTGLTSVTIPPSVMRIGDYAFRHCSALTSVTIPSGVTSIGQYAFYDCGNLVSVRIPASVKSLGSGAFSGDAKLTDVYLDGCPASVFRTLAGQLGNRKLRVYIAAGQLEVCKPVLDLYPEYEVVTGGVVHWDEKVSADCAWTNDLHILSGENVVAAGVRLNIEPGSVVKFLPRASLIAEDGGSIVAKGVVFARASDESVGTNFIYATESDLWEFVAGNLVADEDTECRDIRRDVISGTLTTNAVWESGTVHIIGGTFTVASGVSLVIEPGAVVKCLTGARLEVADGGRCDARGSIFTHVNDDAVGGDSFGDGSATKPEWGVYGVSSRVTDDDTTQYRYTAPTVVSGTISQNAIWRGQKVYKVMGNLTVESGAKLTIQPGTIVKFASGMSLTVRSSATLDAQGTRVAPIVFTSIKDDEWGGDTNEDGDATTAQAGDWHQISNMGTITMDHCQILWCSAQNNQGALYPNGGTWLFKNSIVAHCQYDNMRSYGGTFTAENAMFLDGSMGAAPSSGTVRFVNCVFNNLTTAVRWGRGSFYNCVFSDISEDIIDTEFYSSTLACQFHRCVFWNPESTGDHASAKVGQNGCVYADPLFADPSAWDFRVAANSPCVDAGDGTVAPGTDYYGRPRMDVRKVRDTGVADAAGICPDIGIYEADGLGVGAVPDLAVVSVEALASARAGDEITVTYVVTNRGSSCYGQARDAFVFVAEDAALGGQRVTGGEIAQVYSITSNGVAHMKAHLTVPFIKAGTWRISVTANAERDIYEQVTANNTGKASGTTTVSLPAIDGTVGPVALAAGDNVFEVTALPSAGGTVILKLPAGAAAYGANGYVPGAERSDAAAVDLGGGRVALVFPARNEGTKAYLTVESESEGQIEVEVAETVLALYGSSPARLVNKGTVRLTLTGTGLDGAEVSLVGAATLKAASVEPLDAATAVATFELGGAPVGAYDVRAAAGGKASTLAKAVELYKTTKGPKLEAKFVLPSSVRDGRVYTAWIEYANTGDEDMPAPLFTVKRKDSATRLKVLMSEDFGTNAIHLVGIGSAYPAGVLAAGDSGKIPFYFMPNGTYRLQLSHAAEETAATAYKQFKDTADYRQAVAAAATRLNARGMVEYRVMECVNFVLAERAGRPVAAISGTALDAVTREPLAGVTVTAVMTNDATRTASCTADADGRFSLDMLADGEWQLAVEDAVASGGGTVTVAGQKDVNGRTLAVRQLATVSGTVLAADTHEPLAGAAVRLYRGNGDLPCNETATDENGAFRLKGVVSGTYALVVNSMNGYVGDAVTNVTLALGGAYEAGVFELSKGAVLYGTVTHGGVPVTNGTVYAGYEDGSAARAACSTNGTYCFAGLPPYAYQVRYEGSDVSTDPVAVTLAGQETRMLDLVANPTPQFFPVRPCGYGTLTTRFVVADPVLATNATAFAWDFDNDGNVDLTGEEPEWTYKAVGSYNVRLVATTPQGVKTSVYENCVTVEEAIENVLNANAFRVDETDGIDCKALGENALTLVGTPPMTLASGVVVGGQFGGEWYIRRITGVSQNGKMYTLTTEDATLDDLYASYCFTACAPATVEQSKPKLQARLAKATARSGGDSISRVYANGGLTLVPTVGFGDFKGYFDLAKPLGGESYSHVGFSGKLYFELNGSAEIQVGAKLDPSFEFPISIPTGVPLLDAKGKLTVGASLGAEGKIGGNFRIWANPRLNIGVEKRGNGGWKALRPFALSDRGNCGNWAEVGGSLNGEAYVKVTAGLTALKLAEVMAGAKVSLKESLSTAIGGDTEWNASVGLTGVIEPSLIKSENIPFFGKYLSFVDVGWSVDIGGVDLLLERVTSPSPKFAASQDQGNAPLRVTFADNSEEERYYIIGSGDFSLPPVEYLWDFDDGRTSNAKSPVVDFANDGVYKVSLMVKGRSLSGSRKAMHKVYVGKQKPPEEPSIIDDDNGGTPAKSCDPNEMDGPEGIGENRIVKPGEWMDYTVYFENKADADVAAQEVFVDAQLSPYLDWSTFEMGEVAFNNQNETGLSGLKNGTKTVAQTDADYKVQMSVALDEKTGAARWYLRSYDPNRADYGYWPASVDAGFLPPNDDSHCGEGHITYRVKVREDAPFGVRIDAAASIVFDQNEAIPTDPAWWNTVGDMRQLTLALDGEATTNLTLVAGEAFGVLPTPKDRKGYSFDAWYTEANGQGLKATPEAIVPNGLARLYDNWIANSVNVYVDGVCQVCKYDDVARYETFASVTNGYTNVVCTGWVGTGDVPATGMGHAVSFTVTQPSTLRWLYATNYWVSVGKKVEKTGGGGDVGGSVALKDAAGKPLAGIALWATAGANLTAVATADEGYAFAGWREADGGGTPSLPGGGHAACVALPITRPWLLEAVFTSKVFTVTFDLGAHGTRTGGGALLQTVAWGQAAVAPTFETAKGYAFLGWDKAFERVTGALVVTARWEKTRHELVDEVSSVAVASFAATTYDGYLYRDDDGTVVGTVQVKAAKPKADKKSGRTTTKLTISVQLANESTKLSAKGDYDLGRDEEQSFAVKGRGDVSLLLGANGMTGSFEGYAIEGVPNVFSAKDAESKAASKAAEAAYVGTYNLLADEGTFTVTIAKKGKVKVAGTTAAGKKVSVSTQLLVGEDVACIPVMASKAGIAFTVWLGDDVEIDGLTDAVIGQAGSLPAGSVLAFDAEALAALVGDATYAVYFPDGIAVAQSGTKWVVAPDEKGKAAKAGKVVVDKKTGLVDETKLGANPSALKFTYTAKTGAFKGTFKAYVNSKGKPKSVTVNVSGVMIGTRGYGTATVKKTESIPVTIGLPD